jgi:putative heme-binding domain-containing protein
MRWKKVLRVATPAALAFALMAVASQVKPQAAGRHGIPAHIPWTSSRIHGSPEPPPPFRVERVFPKLTFKNPLLLARAPGTTRLFLGEQAGKLFSFPNDSQCPKADVFLDLTADVHSWDPQGKVRGIEAVYGLTFHPQFTKNRYCYVCYTLTSKTGDQLPDGSRVSRFRVTDTDPPRCDPKSERILLTWLGGGHNGGCLEFGPDGFLYISTGDGANPNPPDVLDTGQALDDLLSCILRIDVDHEDKGKPYAVPKDNPFVRFPGARPEIWAYGFRNPWKMTFDRKSGDLWVGDVGWELWEMVYRVQRGGNYGWSVMEGRQAVRPNAKRGPTPILPPTLDFPHSEAASITGGYVYHGKDLPDLAGHYICGDWVTGRLWATKFDGDRIVTHREIARCPLHIVAFGEDHNGELLFLSYDDVGAIHRLVKNDASARGNAKFPRRLSETGLFASVQNNQPAPGVVPFSVRAAQWADGATAERFVALPGDSSIKLYDRPIPVPNGGFFQSPIFFPADGVLAKTLSIETERGNPASRRRMETQVLHFDGASWQGYSYQWNDEQTDAELVPSSGADRTVTIVDRAAPGGKRRQTWHYPGRAECLQCHNPWAFHALAFTAAQLDVDHDYGGVVDNQLRALTHAGILTRVQAPPSDDPPDPPAAKLLDPYDLSADLNDRARSYLAVNCSHCHQFGAGGTALIDFRMNRSLEQTGALEARPAQGTFDIPSAQLLVPGDPYRSVLYYRMAKLGRGRMPHIGSEVVDEQGLRLISDWIRQLPKRKEERALLNRLCALDADAVRAYQRAADPGQILAAAQASAHDAGRDAPNDEDIRKAKNILEARAVRVVANHTDERAAAIRGLLSSADKALLLAEALDRKRLSQATRTEVAMAAANNPLEPVRDLFERFLPDEQRVKRLGALIRPEQLLGLKGDVTRGRELYLKSGSLCVNCHKIGPNGGSVGPDLSQIGKKYSKAQILESILEPSKTIDPPYVAYVLETTDGKVYTGLLAARTEREVVIKDAEGKEVRIPAGKVAGLIPQKKSLMPEQLLRDLTATQAADLLEFLASLK